MTPARHSSLLGCKVDPFAASGGAERALLEVLLLPL